MAQQIIDIINSVVAGFSDVGPMLGIILIFLESIFPVLPLSVFIALNVLAFGFFFGFLISYFATVAGCLVAFILVRKGFHTAFNKRIKEDSKVDRFMKRINKLKFSSVVLLLALPFTPAFLLNICGALSAMTFRKFIASVLIGKLAIVFFWGFIGSSLIESVTNPLILLEIVLLLIATYIISKVIDQKYGIE